MESIWAAATEIVTYCYVLQKSVACKDLTLAWTEKELLAFVNAHCLQISFQPTDESQKLSAI